MWWCICWSSPSYEMHVIYFISIRQEQSTTKLVLLKHGYYGGCDIVTSTLTSTTTVYCIVRPTYYDISVGLYGVKEGLQPQCLFFHFLEGTWLAVFICVHLERLANSMKVLAEANLGLL